MVELVFRYDNKFLVINEILILIYTILERANVNRPEPLLPLILMIRFPSISVQPLYLLRVSRESIGILYSMSVVLSDSLVLQTVK